MALAVHIQLRCIAITADCALTAFRGPIHWFCRRGLCWPPADDERCVPAAAPPRFHAVSFICGLPPLPAGARVKNGMRAWQLATKHLVDRLLCDNEIPGRSSP